MINEVNPFNAMKFEIPKEETDVSNNFHNVKQATDLYVKKNMRLTGKQASTKEGLAFYNFKDHKEPLAELSPTIEAIVAMDFESEEADYKAAKMKRGLMNKLSLFHKLSEVLFQQQSASKYFDSFVIRSTQQSIINLLSDLFAHIDNDTDINVNHAESLLFDLFNMFIIQLRNDGHINLGQLGGISVVDNKLEFKPSEDVSELIS